MQPSCNQKVMVRMMVCCQELGTNYWLHKFLFVSHFHIVYSIARLINPFFGLCIHTLMHQYTPAFYEYLESNIFQYYVLRGIYIYIYINIKRLLSQATERCQNNLNHKSLSLKILLLTLKHSMLYYSMKVFMLVQARSKLDIWFQIGL